MKLRKFSGWWQIVVGGVVAAVLVGGTRIVFGAVSAYEARQLVQSLIDGALYLAAAIAGASGTTLALMVTVLGLTTRADDQDFGVDHFARVMWTSRLSAASLLGAIALLLMMSIPVVEAEQITEDLYRAVYWSLTVVLALVVGVFVSVVLLLYSTTTQVVHRFHPELEVDSSERDESG